MKRILDVYGSYEAYYDPKNNGLINQLLPHELIQSIFMSLRDADLQVLPTVCTYWKNRTASTCMTNLTEMENFIIFLKNNLKLHDATQSNLLESTVKIDTFNFKMFIHERKRIRNNIFQILLQMKIEDIEKLREVSKELVQLKGFEYIFDFAQIFKKIEIMDKMPLTDEKSAKIHEIGLELAYVIPRMEKNTTTSSKIILSFRYRPLLKKELSTDAVRIAIQYLLYTAKYENRKTLCKSISKVLAIHGETKESLYFLNLIFGPVTRDKAYVKLAKIFLELNKTDEALDTAQFISDDNLRFATNDWIFKTLQEPFNR